MDSPFLVSVLLYFWVFSLCVDSQQDLQRSSPPPPPPPPTPSPPPPPPPPPPSPPPPPRSPLNPPPPPRKAPHPPGSRNTMGSKQQHRKHHHPPPPPSPPRRRSKNLKVGKKLGFIFVGLAAILQICVVTFLVIKRRHLMKTHEDRYFNRTEIS